MDDREGIESPVELSDRNWSRVINAATKAGYREGIEEGKQSNFQKGFDIGYEDGFKTAFILGKYKGLITSLDNNQPSPSPVDYILEKTRRGACHICAEDSKESQRMVDDFTEPPLEGLRNEQRKHSEKAISTLRQHFEKSLQDKRVPVDDFTFSIPRL